MSGQQRGPLNAIDEIRYLRVQIKVAKRKLARAALAAANSTGVEINPSSEDLVHQVFTAVTLPEEFGETSDERALWEEQMHLMQKGKAEGFRSKGTRYSPAMLNFALWLLATTSNTLYEQLSKVLVLPNIRNVKRDRQKRKGRLGTNVNGINIERVHLLLRY